MWSAANWLKKLCVSEALSHGCPTEYCIHKKHQLSNTSKASDTNCTAEAVRVGLHSWLFLGFCYDCGLGIFYWRGRREGRGKILQMTLEVKLVVRVMPLNWSPSSNVFKTIKNSDPNSSSRHIILYTWNYRTTLQRTDRGTQPQISTSPSQSLSGKSQARIYYVTWKAWLNLKKKNKIKRDCTFSKWVKDSCVREHPTLLRMTKILGWMQKNHLKNISGHSALWHVYQFKVNKQSSKKRERDEREVIWLTLGLSLQWGT